MRPDLHIERLYPNVPNFELYQFEFTVPVEFGVSALTVEIINTETGESFIADNGGKGFPVSDSLQTQVAISSRKNVFSRDLQFFEQRNLTVAVNITISGALHIG